MSKSYVELNFFGDLCLPDQNNFKFLASNYNVFKHLSLSSEAIKIANLECSISDKGEIVNKSKFANLRAPSQAIKFIEGLDVALLANNHLEDFGQVAALDTVNILNKHNIQSCGYGNNILEAIKPLYIERNGIKISIINACCLTTHPNFFASHTSAGVTPLGLPLLKELIKEIRKNVDIVIFCPHWGEEYEAFPTLDQMIAARRLIEWGADLIVGCHAHVIQAFEKYKGKWIFYGIGNFLFPNITINAISSDGNKVKKEKTLSRKEKESLMINFAIEKANAQCRISLKEVVPLIFNDDYQPKIHNNELTERKTHCINRLTRVGAILYHGKILSTFSIYYSTRFTTGSQRFKHYYSLNKVYPYRISLVIYSFFLYFRLLIKKVLRKVKF